MPSENDEAGINRNQIIQLFENTGKRRYELAMKSSVLRASGRGLGTYSQIETINRGVGLPLFQMEEGMGLTSFLC